MAGSEALGIKRLDSLLFYVHDASRSHRFYTESMDFAHTGRSGLVLETASGERSAVYEAGEIKVVITQPLTPTSRSARYLKRHPDGIRSLTFEVEDVEKTFAVLDERGATIVSQIAWHRDRDGGRYGAFEITTPFGEALFRFIQRESFAPYAPGYEHNPGAALGTNRLGFTAFDHVTSNFLTLGPMSLWCTEVLGLEKYWDIAFHTDDVAPDNDHGSGLKSIVFWDPRSQVKFANNEPMRPHFEDSQIFAFVMDNHGAGIQHAALATTDILSTVQEMRTSGVVFMPTPGPYYDALPERLTRLGIDTIDEDIDTLRHLGILVDGKGHKKYLLQIFLKEAAGLYGDDDAGPFFFEIIHRKGDPGFGGGNFRALFESIEREQKADQLGSALL